MADTIVITTAGDSVTAALYGKTGVKRATVQCDGDFINSAATAVKMLDIAEELGGTLDWQAFRNGDIGVLVNTQNIGRFLAECESLGINWEGGSAATSFNPLKKERVSECVIDAPYGRILYSTCEEFSEDDEDIEVVRYAG